MEEPETLNSNDKGESNVSPIKDESLKDFKSPKSEPVIQTTNKVKILKTRRTTKPSSKSKSSSSNKKKDGSSGSRRTNNEKDQPSIESSFFKAANEATRSGHTCPLCMKFFSDVSAGTAHSKNCATRNNVSTRKLLAAVELQERQANERVAIGLPAGPYVRPKDKTPRRNNPPMSKNDQDLQLALALSKSLQENQVEQEFEEALVLASEHGGSDPIVEMTNFQRKKTLKNFGFSTNKPDLSGGTSGPGRWRKKKHLGPTILETRTQESRDRYLTERIAEILMGNEVITQVCQKSDNEEDAQLTKPTWTLRSRLLKKIHRTTNRLWDSARLSAEVTNFYVEDLSPVVVPIADCQQEKSSNSREEINEIEDDLTGETNGVTSEVNEKEEIRKSPKNSLGANKIADNPKNIHVTDRQYRNSLVADWKNTLDVSSMSDVIILVKDNHIWAHKLVFFVRCSEILLDCEINDDQRFPHVREKISWLDIDNSTALAFLEFVYSGLIEKNCHVFDDNRLVAGVRRLARKYRLKNLFDYLRKRKAEINVCSNAELPEEGLRSAIIINAWEVENKEKNLCGDEIPEREIEENKIHEDVNIAENGLRDPIIIDASEMDEKNLQKNKKQDHPCPSTPIVLDYDEIQPEKNYLQDNEEQKENNESEIDAVDFLENGLHDPIIIDASEMDEENLQNNKKHDPARPSTPVVLDYDEIQREKNYLQDNKDQRENGESEVEENSSFNENLVHSPSRSTHGEKFLEKSNISTEKNDDKMEIISIHSSVSARSSPDLFDETIQAETMQDAEKSEAESTEEVTEVSSKENENLDILAQLIDEDFAMEDDSQKSSTSSTNELANKSPMKDLETEQVRFSRSIETSPSPKIIANTSKNGKFSQSRNSPKKTKSDLSLFIDKVKRINAKPASDSYSEDDTLGITVDRRRFKNPFNVNNVSNESIRESEKIAKPKSMREEGENNFQNTNENFDESVVNEISRSRLGSHDELSFLVDDTDDENISMYAKYKKNNNQNNSIVKYRELLAESTELTHKEKKKDDGNKNCQEIDSEEKSDTEPNESDENSRDSSSSASSTSQNSICEKTKNAINSLDFSDDDVFAIDEEILADESKSSPNKSSPSSRKNSFHGDEESDDGSTETAKINSKNTEIEESAAEKSFQRAKVSENSNAHCDGNVIEMDDVIFTQSLRNLEQTSPTLTPKRRSNVFHKDHEKSCDESLSRGESPRNSENHSHFDFIDSDNIIFTQNSKYGNCPPRTLSPSARTLSPSPRCETSPELAEIDCHERINEIFTQSLINRDVSPGRNLSQSMGQTNVREPSPILISSSPEPDMDFEGYSLKPDSDKENASTIESSPEQQSIASHNDRFSFLNYDLSQSSQPETRRKESSPSKNHQLSNSIRKLSTRSISMPASTSNYQNSRGDKKTPNNSSRYSGSRYSSPPANYDAMDTPELKRELDKYGIKPQKRKRARQLLYHIYHELHAPESAMRKKNSKDMNYASTSDDGEPPVKKMAQNNDRDSDDCDKDMSLSQESNTSQGSVVIPEETVFPDAADVSPNKIASSTSIRQAFDKLMEGDKSMRNKYLTYEPLLLEPLHSRLKEQGFKCKLNELMDFLDGECITYKVVSQMGKNRTRGKGKKNAKQSEKS